MNDGEKAVQAIADEIFSEHATRRTFAPLPADILKLGSPFAYRVQERLVDRFRRETGSKVGGFKVGLTTPRMQRMCGVGEPIGGVILADRIRDSGSVLDRGAFGRLGLECEIAVRIAERIVAPLAAAELAARIDLVCAAFEIVDDRNADYSRLDACSLVADNSWNGGLVLGPAMQASAFGSLKGRVGRLSVNGVETDEGISDDVLGDPFNSATWLISNLLARGVEVEAGSWIATGSIVPTRFPEAGDHYQFAVDGLPGVDADIV